MKLACELRERASRGEPLFGTFVTEITTPGLAVILKRCGFAFYVIDLEHACIDDSQMRTLIDAGRRHGLCPIVRVADASRATITRALDAGAEGIIVAMTRSLEDATAAVQATKYPPDGRRGVHMLRPHTNFDPPKDIAAHMALANRSLITGIQIETAEAVDLIEPLAAMPGIDLLYVGPVDLSVAIGRPGAAGNGQVLDVAERTARACRAHGKLAGIHAADAATLSRLVPAGMSLFGYAADMRLLWSGAQAFMDEVRRIVARPGRA